MQFWDECGLIPAVVLVKSSFGHDLPATLTSPQQPWRYHDKSNSNSEAEEYFFGTGGLFVSLPDGSSAGAEGHGQYSFCARIPFEMLADQAAPPN